MYADYKKKEMGKYIGAKMRRKHQNWEKLSYWKINIFAPHTLGQDSILLVVDHEAFT